MERTKRALAATLLSVAVLLLASPYAAQMVAQTVRPPSGGGVSGLTCSATTCTFTLLGVFPDGSAAAPGIAFTTQTNTGLAYIANGIQFVTQGARRGYITASGGWVLERDFITFGATSDVLFNREAAATIQQGVDAATATAQVYKGPDSTGANVAGGNITLRAGAGTAGNATGGQLILGGGANAGTGERGAVQIEDGGTQPTCAAGIRGSLWYEAGGAGVADTFEICGKQAAGDTYAWRVAATIP